MQSLLLVDVDNLYYAIRAKFGNRKLMIKKYVQAVEKHLGHTLDMKIAYGKQHPHECEKYINRLIENKFLVYFGQSSWYASMALTVASKKPQRLVIGSNHVETLAIAEWFGGPVTFFASGVPTHWPFETVEICEGLLDAAANKSE